MGKKLSSISVSNLLARSQSLSSRGNGEVFPVAFVFFLAANLFRVLQPAHRGGRQAVVALLLGQLARSELDAELQVRIVGDVMAIEVIFAVLMEKKLVSRSCSLCCHPFAFFVRDVALDVHGLPPALPGLLAGATTGLAQDALLAPLGIPLQAVASVVERADARVVQLVIVIVALEVVVAQLQGIQM